LYSAIRENTANAGADHSDHQQTAALSWTTVSRINFVTCPATVWW